MEDKKFNVQYKEGDSCFYVQVPRECKSEILEVGGIWDPAKKSWKFAVDVKIWDAIEEKFAGRGFTTNRYLERDIEKLREEQKTFFKLRDFADEDNPIEYGVDGISLEGKNPLFNYQKWGIKCGLHVEGGFLIGDAPGLGKTIQALGIALQRKNEGKVDCCLIICPASLKYNWLAEIKKFTKERALVVDGTPEEREKKWKAAGYFFKIVNYEAFVKDVYVNSDPNKKEEPLSRGAINFRRFLQKRFKMVIVDEIHLIKHHSAKRSLAVKQMKSEYKLGLSGTPVDGTLEELHSIFEFLKPGLFESKSRFIANHSFSTDGYNNVVYINTEKVQEKIKPYFIRRHKENVLKDLPEKIYKDIYVELGEREHDLYADLVKGRHEITEEVQAATQILRARQFLDFPGILNMKEKSCKFAELSKLLGDLVDGNQEKVLIFTQYKEVLDLIVFNLKGKYNILQIHGGVGAKERIEIVDKFNSDKRFSILIGTDAMSTGLNIGGANAVIHYEDNYSPAIMQQRNDRAHRATTRHNVTIYRFICVDTLEERIRKVLGNKMSLNNAVLDENCSEFETTNFSNLDLLKYL